MYLSVSNRKGLFLTLYIGVLGYPVSEYRSVLVMGRASVKLHMGGLVYFFLSIGQCGCLFLNNKSFLFLHKYYSILSDLIICSSVVEVPNR